MKSNTLFLCLLCFSLNAVFGQKKSEPHFLSLLKQAKAYKTQKKYDSAIVYLEKAVDDSQHKKRWEDYVKATIAVSDIYKVLKKMDKADSVFAAGQMELNKVSQSIPKIYARFIGAYHKFLLVRNDTDAIIPLYANLLNTAKRLSPSVLRDSLMQESYYWLGYMNYELEKLSESLIYMDSSTFLIHRIYGDRHIKNVSQLIGTSKVYQLIGDYAKAHTLLEQAHGIIKNNKVDPMLLAESYMSLGSILSTRNRNENDSQEALAYFQKGLAFISKHKEVHKHYFDIYQKEIAEVYFDLKDFKRALEHIELSLAHWDKYYAPEYGPQAFILFAKSKILSRIGKYEEALDILDISNELFLDVNSSALADNFLLTGDIYRFMGKPKAADSMYQRAIEVLIPDFEAEMMVNENFKPDETLFDGLIKKAEVNAEMYDQRQDLKHLTISYDFYQIAVNYLTTTRKRFFSDHAKIDLSKRTRNVYSEAINVCVKLYTLTGEDRYLKTSFSIADRNRYNTLLENIQNQQIHLRLKIPQQTRDMEKALRKDVYNARARFRQFKTDAAVDSPLIDSLKNEVGRTESRFQAFLNKVEQEHPEYTHLKYGSITIDFKRLAAMLNDDEVMIQYFIGEPGTLYIFALSQEELFFKEQKWHADVAAQLRDFMANKNDFDPAFARKQYKLLLEDVLKKFPSATRLIILPDRELSNLPFEALITSSQGSKKTRYLIEDYTISYHYSANVLLNTYERKKPTRRFVAYAPEVSGGLQSLWWAKQEVNTLAKLFDGDLVMGTQATKSHFFSNAGQYDMIHLATHGVVNNEHPLLSKLYFSDTEKSGSNDVLFGYELFNTELTANLVTLGACETASGNILEGEGIWSLGHGFSYAGVPNIVMSLWQLSDQPANDIITSFYRNVEDGFPYVDALRQAKLEYLKSSDKVTSNPFFWSSFVFFGDIDRPSESSGYFYWSILLLLPAIVAMFYFRRKRSFQRLPGKSEAEVSS
ncbi:CHAT domain-containing protein [Fulvivirgaceae bacterium BMA12]|uniref:CHAT domain-containing protein n=1 Tax=Agaribacillus aureus TaxID=3051825 RepID=A0ABT8L1M2_9BACT|nr:CHAT domain-containing protein [Fulvivirgaceae bacterium BMA12]